MNGKWTIFGVMALLAVLLVASVAVVLQIDMEPEGVEEKRGPERTRNFGEGIRLSQKGLIGFDLVSIGKARMRKLRKGPFTIGALNELVLENVSLALPEALWNADAAKPADGKSVRAGSASAGDGDTGAKRMLGALGIEPGHIRMGEKIPRFSALAIKKLSVARIVDGTNAVPWFAAAGGNVGRYGLELYSGWSVEDGVSNSWKEALLTIDPKLELHWR